MHINDGDLYGIENHLDDTGIAYDVTDRNVWIDIDGQSVLVSVYKLLLQHNQVSVVYDLYTGFTVIPDLIEHAYMGDYYFIAYLFDKDSLL